MIEASIQTKANNPFSSRQDRWEQNCVPYNGSRQHAVLPYRSEPISHPAALCLFPPAPIHHQALNNEIAGSLAWPVCINLIIYTLRGVGYTLKWKSICYDKGDQGGRWHVGTVTPGHGNITEKRSNLLCCVLTIKETEAVVGTRPRRSLARQHRNSVGNIQKFQLLLCVNDKGDRGGRWHVSTVTQVTVALCDDYSLPVDFVNKRRPLSLGSVPHWSFHNFHGASVDEPNYSRTVQVGSKLSLSGGADTSHLPFCHLGIVMCGTRMTTYSAGSSLGYIAQCGS
ncbi:hypothetical protein J6590_023914 [Homalodisca vitripennis]|nr:hypothetical protein J6590_023914 [Homalodisca vitripennis]